MTIYILRIKFASGDIIKIGRTTNLEKRLKNYKRSFVSDRDLKLEYSEMVEDGVVMEAYIKTLFQNRIKPEWFESGINNEEILKLIQERVLTNLYNEKYKISYEINKDDYFYSIKIDNILSVTTKRGKVMINLKDGTSMRLITGMTTVYKELKNKFKKGLAYYIPIDK